jgi:hypothetical protein
MFSGIKLQEELNVKANF